jgi:hypothetical protein
VLQSLVHEIKHHLCFVYIVSFDQPQVVVSVEIRYVYFSFVLLFAGADVRNRLEVMVIKNLRNARVSCIVHYTEEGVEVGLLVTILYSSQLVVDTHTVVTACLN